MNPSPDMPDRLTRLEEKFMFLEQQVSALDDVTRSLHDQIDALDEAVSRLRTEIKSKQTEQEDGGSPRSLEEERPPHWG